MSFIKLEPIKGGHGGCLCCGYQHEVLPMDKLIAVGFGIATVTKDEEVIYDENSGCELWMTLEAEDFAKVDPDHDWRIHLVAPLSERHYQRQGECHWVLYEKGQGFASVSYTHLRAHETRHDLVC